MRGIRIAVLSGMLAAVSSGLVTPAVATPQAIQSTAEAAARVCSPQGSDKACLNGLA